MKKAINIAYCIAMAAVIAYLMYMMYMDFIDRKERKARMLKDDERSDEYWQALLDDAQNGALAVENLNEAQARITELEQQISKPAAFFKQQPAATADNETTPATSKTNKRVKTPKA